MKKLFFLVIIIISFYNVYPQIDNADIKLKFPYEGLSWGMNLEEVKNITGADKSDWNMLTKSIKDSSYLLEVDFLFSKDKLYNINYHYTLKEESYKNYVDFFFVKESELISAYGKTDLEYSWVNDIAENVGQDLLYAAMEDGKLNSIYSSRYLSNGSVSNHFYIDKSPGVKLLNHYMSFMK